MTRAKPNSVGAYEAKTRFSELLERVERGQEVTITKYGAPVARLIPVRMRATPEERRAAIERWRRTSKGLTLGKLRRRDLVGEDRP